MTNPTGDPLYIDVSAGAPEYNAAELRRAMAVVLQYANRVYGGRQGVRPGGTGLQTSIAGTTITVKGGLAVVDPGLTVTQGPYWVALAADSTFTLSPQVAQPRKDITYLRVQDHTEDASGQRRGLVEYLAGTPAASPSEPAVPLGAFRLATIDVPASGGGSPTVTNNFPWTVAAGGVLPVRNATERTSFGPFYDGGPIYRQDRDWLEIYDGAAWRVVGIPHTSSTADRDSSITSPYNGQLAYTSDTGKMWQRHGGAWRDFPQAPRAHLRQTAVQLITPAGFSAMEWQAEDRDSHNGHSNVTNPSRYTIQMDGDYFVSGGASFVDTGAAVFHALEWRKNGATVADGSTSDASAVGAVHRMAAKGIMIPGLVVGDYVELWAFSGVNNNTYVVAGAQSSMSIFYIGG